SHRYQGTDGGSSAGGVWPGSANTGAVSPRHRRMAPSRRIGLGPPGMKWPPPTPRSGAAQTSGADCQKSRGPMPEIGRRVKGIFWPAIQCRHHSSGGMLMRQSLSVLAVLAAALVARADISSGPKAGEKVEDFKVYGVVGAIENKEGSYVKDRKDDPTVYVFVQHEHFNRPMARLLKELDTKAKETNDKAATIAVWLTEKQDAAKEHLPKIQMSLNFVNTSLGVFEGDKSGPNNWGINVDAHCTVVIVHKGKAVESIALQSANETDAAKVVEALKKAK